MARLRRRWRMVKWAGLILSGMIVVAWAGSLIWSFQYGRAGQPPQPQGNGISVYHQLVLRLDGGCVGYWYNPFEPFSGDLRSRITARLTPPIWAPQIDGWVIVLPLWIPLFLVMIPTGFLWWADSRPSLPKLWSLKRSMVFVCVIMLAAWGSSLAYTMDIGACKCALSLRDGTLVLWDSYDPYQVGGRLQVDIEKSDPDGFGQPTTYGFTLPTMYRSSGMGDGQLCTIPLWLLLLPPLGLTVTLFFRVRRRIPPGHCQKCGYNLTGNISGICPECGERI